MLEALLASVDHAPLASRLEGEHQEKVLHVDMRFFLNMHVGKKSHVDMEKSHVNMRFFPNMAF